MVRTCIVFIHREAISSKQSLQLSRRHLLDIVIVDKYLKTSLVFCSSDKRITSFLI